MMLAAVVVLAAACGASRIEPGNLAVGTWGGEEAGLLVRADGAHAHIGCTYGDIAGPIPFDADGHFDVAAQWNVTAFRPPRRYGPGPGSVRGHVRARANDRQLPHLPDSEGPRPLAAVAPVRPGPVLRPPRSRCP